MLGVCYYPEHWDESRWATDAQRMQALGISHVRIGEFAWSRIEPCRGAFDFGWLDRAIGVLADAGLRVVLGTPTATPPKWLVDEAPEVLPHDEAGRPRGFGSRRHYTLSSPRWWEESARIVTALADRYGTHPALVGWQTDNEFGCHDTVLSWGPADLAAFRGWLRRRYQTVDQLNAAWSTVFWSQELRDFDAVGLPCAAVTDINPAARMDFWRFKSGEVAAYNAMQCAILRDRSPGRWITHNFMGFFADFDHFDVGADLDFAAWDSYPTGFVEVFPFTEAERDRWARTSHPDVAPFHHDLYRAVGNGRFWVMEQQPGPVNWAPWNPVPAPGMVRLWTWEALAHGAELVNYFRWRQAPFAQEQMHAGLNLPGLDELSPGGLEAAEVARELEALGRLPPTGRARVALVFDYPSHWATTIQPQGRDFRYLELAFRWYEALRRLGLDVDFRRAGDPLAGYALVVVPCVVEVSDALREALAQCGAVVLIGPRSGSRTRDFAIPEGLPPGPLAGLTGNRVLQVATLRPGLSDGVTGAVAEGPEGRAIRWREYVETTAEVIARFDDGGPALTRNGAVRYLACWPDEALLGAVIAEAVAAAGLATTPLPAGVRLRRRGPLRFAFNYGDAPWTLPDGLAAEAGTTELAPRGVAIWRAPEATADTATGPAASRDRADAAL